MTQRERYLKFKKLHPEKIREYNKRWRLKQRCKCIVCGGEIPFPNQGSRVCSKKCRKVRTRQMAITIQHKAAKTFKIYKERRGCKLCGYNKYGGSLDFHHIGEKEARIGYLDWWYKTATWKKESKKCILVCKNCHYELHKR